MFVACLAVAVACKSPAKRDDSKEPEMSSTRTPDATAPAVMDARDDVAVEKTSRLCHLIDAPRLAKLIGATSLTLSRTGETLMSGGVGPVVLTCSLRERMDAYAGFDFGFSIEAENTLEERDGLDRFEWEPYELLGRSARIGVAVDSLHVQVVVNGVRLHVDLAHDTISPLELEKPLVAATAYIVELLPDDAPALLR